MEEKLHHKNEMIARLTSLGIKDEHALLLHEYAKDSKELKYLVDSYGTLEIIKFGNKITPANWILHPRGPAHELKPGTLYVEIDTPDSEECKEIFKRNGKFAWVDLPMIFLRLSDLAGAGDKRATTALKIFGDGIIAQISMTLCTETHSIPWFVLTHELAHVGSQRYLSQKLKSWKGRFIHTSDDKMETHGLVYQWVYDLLIKRVEKNYRNEFGELIINECRKDLETIQDAWAYKIADILYSWTEGTIKFEDRNILAKIKRLSDKDLDFAIKSIEPYYEF